MRHSPAKRSPAHWSSASRWRAGGHAGASASHRSSSRRCSSALLIIGIWYVISYLVIAPRRRFLLRPPHDVLQEGFLEWESLSELLGALWASSKVALIGLAISIVLGMLMAVIMSQAKLVERAMFPYLVILQAIPILAVVPAHRASGSRRASTPASSSAC
ncbi:MAG: hypothetical protein WKF58_07750 [Ilumatobacteraceae bacterium]